MTSISNEVLATQIQGTNSILERVEKKVDEYAAKAISPQVFELKIKELQIGINNNSLEIIEIKKEMAQDKKDLIHAKSKADDERTIDRQAKVSLVVAGIFTLAGAIVSGLLVYFLSRS